MARVEAIVWANNWWAVTLRGIVAVAFGLVALIAPGLTVLALVIAFGAYAFVDGVLAVITAVRRRDPSNPWWMLLLEGIGGIGVGVLTFVWPLSTALALLYVIASWAIVTGVFEIITAVRLRKTIEGEWLLALSGVASVALGILLFVWPGPGSLALALWVGVYALVFGSLLIALGLRFRSWNRSHPLRDASRGMPGQPQAAHGAPRA